MSGTRAEQAKALEQWADRVQAAELGQARAEVCEFVIEGLAVSKQPGKKERLRRWEEKVR